MRFLCRNCNKPGYGWMIEWQRHGAILCENFQMNFVSLMATHFVTSNHIASKFLTKNVSKKCYGCAMRRITILLEFNGKCILFRKNNQFSALPASECTSVRWHFFVPLAVRSISGMTKVWSRRSSWFCKICGAQYCSAQMNSLLDSIMMMNRNIFNRYGVWDRWAVKARAFLFFFEALKLPGNVTANIVDATSWE